MTCPAEYCIYCWGHPLLHTFSGSVAIWMLLSGNLQSRVAEDVVVCGIFGTIDSEDDCPHEHGT